MSIKEYKLGDITFVKTGNKNKNDQVINGLYNFFTRSQNILKCNNFTIDGKYTIIPGEGIFTPMWNNGKAAIHQRVYFIKANNNYIKDKYLFYWWTKNNQILYRSAVGTTVKSLRYDNFVSPKIKLPDLSLQQSIIDIIEPFERRRDNLLEQKKYLELKIKLIYSKSKSSIYKQVKEIVNMTKHKKIDSHTILDLSSISSNDLFNLKFKNVNDFKTNIYSINEDQVYISTIRPKLEKYGYAWTKSNVLGTILCFDGLQCHKSNLLAYFCQDSFKVQAISHTHGTKMPILDKDWLINSKLKILNNIEIYSINNIIMLLKNYSKQIYEFNKIISLLIQKYIR